MNDMSQETRDSYQLLPLEQKVLCGLALVSVVMALLLLAGMTAHYAKS